MINDSPFADADRCKAEKRIEDECSIGRFRCELERAHMGDHRATYPGQWGKTQTPVLWRDEDTTTAQIRGRD